MVRLLITNLASGSVNQLGLDHVSTALATNFPLPEHLKTTIRTHIYSEKGQLTILDGEIRRTRALLNELRQQHTHRSAQLERYQMALAPYRDLPIEVLSEIFLRSLAEWGVPIPRSNMDAPWNIIRICSLWRQLGLSTPEFWTRLNLGLMGQGSPGQANHMMNSVAKAVIDASQNYPLAVRTDFGTIASKLVIREIIFPVPIAFGTSLFEDPLSASVDP